MTDKLGIIVGDQKDFAALKARFGNTFQIVKTDGPRGHDITAAEIVSAARKQIAMLRFYSSEILLLIEHDLRGTSYAKFVREVTLLTRKLGSDKPIQVAIPNRTIENWYLADIEHLSKKKKFLRGNLKQRDYEGTNGRTELEKLFHKNVSYNEVIHGAQMFMMIRFNVARSNSASFDAFYDVIRRYL